MAEISNEAKIELYKQQIALLEMIVNVTKEQPTVWGKYVDSVLPYATITDGEFEVRDETNIAIRYMRYFRDSVFSGVTPSVEILASIAEFFDKYLNDDSGMLTLDESFKLRHKARIGNPIKQKKWLQNKATILMAMWLQRKLATLRGQKLSIENAAGKIIEEWDLEADAEALKKEYTKSEIDKIHENDYYPARPEVILDLEKGLEGMKKIYLSGKIIEGKTTFKIFTNKSTLEALLRDLIEYLGKK
jgi:hypothetical protein